MKRNLIIVTLTIVFAATMVLAADTRLQKETDETVAYLLAFVAQSDCTFIRNGQSYTGKRAADHLKSKYEYYKDQIATPEDFIRLAATKSMLSGKPYLIRTTERKELRSDEWLKQILEEYRRTRKDREEKKPAG